MDYWKKKVTIGDIVFFLFLVFVMFVIAVYFRSRGSDLYSLIGLFVCTFAVSLRFISWEMNKIKKELDELKASLKIDNADSDNSVDKK
jgi:hypothetical protein